MFQNALSTSGGYILALDNISPANAPQSPMVLPPLRSWSQATALQWESASGNNPAPLQFAIRVNIANYNTRNIIREAAVSIGRATIPKWPGLDFQPAGDDEPQMRDAFYAVLGSYHAAGPGYMLAQHRSIFGRRYINKMRVWDSESPYDTGEATKEGLKTFNANMVVYISAV